MPTEWPGYTVPTTGSSANDGTPVLSSYVNREAAILTQYGADGADTTQQPPQYYGNWVNQKRNEFEAHGAPGAPGKPTVAASPTTTAIVSWTASTPPPSQNYLITASTGQTKLVAPTALTGTVTGLTTASTPTFTVTAIGRTASTVSVASNSYTVT